MTQHAHISRLIKKTVAFYISAFFIVLSIMPAYAVELDSHDALESLISEAIKNNPELRSYEIKIEAYEQRPSQASALDDPRMTFAIANLPVDSFRFDREPMTQKLIQVMQKIPFPGTLKLRGNVAAKDIAIARTEYDEAKNTMIRQVSVLYNTILFLDNALKITGDNRNLLAEFIKSAETRYETGQGGQGEILKARIELSRIIQKDISLKQKRETSVARLNTLLNRAERRDIHVGGELYQRPFVFTFDELQKIARKTRPVLRGLEQKIDQSRMAIDLAKKEYYPEMDFGVSYGQRENSTAADRPDFLSASVTINLPLWYRSKESRKVMEKKADQRKAEEQYIAMQNSITFRLQELLSQVNMYNQEIELFKTGLIPQATLSFESAMSGYRVNKADFLTIINNQISLYNYEIEYYRSIADHANTIAELEETVGRRLF
ncbi:MAG: TolC family protein [Nitrospiraceae bacterium]|nr:MAG: TolC family protein [Nitrospiraceae bacterium]